MKRNSSSLDNQRFESDEGAVEGHNNSKANSKEEIWRVRRHSGLHVISRGIVEGIPAKCCHLQTTGKDNGGERAP